MRASASNVWGDEVNPKKIQRILSARWSDWLKEGCMGDPDEALVLQSQNGDPAAFEALIRKHQHMIHSLTFRMTGSMADAEDLAQETFIRAYRQIGSYRGASKFSTWLYRIAINLCLTWRQREGRRGEIQADWTEMNGAPSCGHENSLNGAVHAAVLKLPAKQRAAIMLTVYDGLNHADAAQILNCSETTVSWRIFAARRKLKRWLTKGEA
jgi:RNA polymerase sigma-70 factor (ECF subfamily)